MVYEEADQFGNFMKVPVVNRGVEKHREREAARPGDVFLADGVEAGLGGMALASLRGIDMERDILKPGLRQLGEQGAGGPDAIGEEGGAKTMLAQAANDGGEIVVAAQGWLAAGNLYGGSRSVRGGNRVDATEQLGQRQVVDRFRHLGEVTQRAVQVAALRHLQGDAADRPSAA